MKAITRSIPIGKDEHASITLVDAVHRVDDLEKQMHEQIWISWWAVSIVNLTHVRDMALITLVQMDAVPAARELDLCSKAGATVCPEHVWLFGDGPGLV